MSLIFLFSNAQFNQVMSKLTNIDKSLAAIKDAIDNHADRTTEGFGKVAEAISGLQTPEPPPDDDGIAVEGVIVGRYKLNEDVAGNGPVEFDIEAKDFKSAAGTPVGAGDIDLSVDSSSSNVTAELSNQTLSDDGNSVKGHVKLTGATQQATQELAVVTYHAKNRDTGAEVAADTDEFETGPGEASIGTIDSPVPLDEVV